MFDGRQVSKNYTSIERGLYENIVGDKFLSRHYKNMSEIEQRFVESILNEAMFEKGVIITNHVAIRMKERNISRGRLEMAIRLGKIMEIQFDKTGVRVVVSFATSQQFKKGYTNVVVYDIVNGHIITIYNKQRQAEKKHSPETYDSSLTGKQYILENNTNIISLVNQYLQWEPSPSELVSLIRKYDKSNMNDKSEKKIRNFLDGKTLLAQL